ncbi:4-hydroxybenzoate octaprenyltransferase [uncultured Cocleimonas sp.]|uniref:4-hydroxybenzoate octaprenyltransferase n=1 Tax=uncultured Cocleimonas sp. TaxID=1051587 RepID=UPI0026124E31|nr:4-hydroxybenzoate octaprenyltransferase [uncultured Cocleimonas sp.]
MNSEKLKLYAELIRFDRPIGTYLLLWPTLWALWIASEGIPDFKLLIIFSLGVFLMRSAGCAINDYADRDIDLHVARTKNRPLTSGKISANEALSVFVALCLVAFLIALQLNTLTIMLSVVAVALAASYPFMKRYHHFPQVHLGAAFSWSIPMAYTAVTGILPPAEAWLLYIAALLWTTAYDTQYGMVDKEDDLEIGVKSTAILFGKYDNFIIATLQLLALIIITVVGIMTQRGPAFYTSILLACGFIVYQQTLTKYREPQKCLTAFLNNNWLGMVIFIGIAIDYA